MVESAVWLETGPGGLNLEYREKGGEEEEKEDKNASLNPL
jgi:hypothetical protein